MNPSHAAYSRMGIRHTASPIGMPWITHDRDEGTPDLTDDEPDAEDNQIIVGEAALRRVQNLRPATHQLQGYQQLHHHNLFGELQSNKNINVALVDGDFLRVKHVLRHVDTQQDLMRGWRLRRSARIDNRMPKTAGELCMLVTAAVDDKRSDWEKGLEDVELDQIDYDAPNYIREVFFTNQEYPDMSDQPRMLNEKGEMVRDGQKVLREGRLVCRRKHIVHYSQEHNRRAEPVEQVIKWLTRDEADKGYGIWDEGKIIRFGNAGHVERMRQHFTRDPTFGIISRATSSTITRINHRPRDRAIVDEGVEIIDELTFQQVMRRHHRQRTHTRESANTYLAADVCCGGGGASGGIEETPFKLAWGLDKDIGAARAWSLNWPDATTYHMDIMEFNKLDISACPYVHVLHCSFSCKAWSWANRYKGSFEHNPEDIATTLSAGPLLKELRPRFATFENADAFQAIKKHKGYLDAFLLTIINEGYNVRWRIVDLARYGNPQHRKRLIVIASCAGESLPEFPAPTHGPEPGLKPFRTVRDAIRGNNKHDPLQNEEQMRQRWHDRRRKNMSPARWDDVLPHGMTTGGPTDIHPDGDREFTIREVMDLQRFRREHKLPADLSLTKMREIAGNAVPRDLIRMIYNSFHEALVETDAKIAKYRNVNIDEEPLLTPSPTPAHSAPATPARRSAKRARMPSGDSITLSGSDDDLAASFETAVGPLGLPIRPLKRQRTADGTSTSQVSHVAGATPTKTASVPAESKVIDLTGE